MEGKLGEHESRQDMSRIVSIHQYRREKSAQKGFRNWKTLGRSGVCLDGNTTWSDLPDDMILLVSEEKIGRAHV